MIAPVTEKDRAAADLWRVGKEHVRRHDLHRARMMVAATLRIMGAKHPLFPFYRLPWHVQQAIAAGAVKAGR